MEPDHSPPLKSPQPKTQHPPVRAVGPLADGWAPGGAAGAFLAVGVEAIFAQGGKEYNFHTSRGASRFSGGNAPLGPSCSTPMFLGQPPEGLSLSIPERVQTPATKKAAGWRWALAPTLTLTSSSRPMDFEDKKCGLRPEKGTWLAARLDPM